MSLVANATDADDGVAQVEFFAESTSLGVVTSPPYQTTWSTAALGPHTLTAVAMDTRGAATISAPVTITVTAAVPPTVIDEIVLHAVIGPQITGGWVWTNDTTAAAGARLQNPNRGVAKVATPVAAPMLAFDLVFNADSGKAYRLWLRGIAEGNSYANDAVYVQFDNSVDASGAPIWRTDHDNRHDADSRRLQRLRCAGLGMERQRVRQRRAWTARVFRIVRTAAHPHPGARRWAQNR